MQQPLETGATRGIVAVRVGLLLLIASGGIAVALTTRSGTPEHARSAPRYVCPMHHEITTSAPGECPICNMALVPMPEAAASREVATGPAHAGAKHAFAVTAMSAEHQRRSAIDQARKRVFSQELAAPATVEADGTITATLYRDELATLRSGDDKTSFTRAGATPQSFAVKLGAAPPSAWDPATLRVRFEFVAAEDAGTARPSAGSVGAITAQLRPHEALVVPDLAVMNGENGPYVWVAADATHFERRALEIGRSLNGMTVITSGLTPGERVAAGRAFFVDAERQLRAGATAPSSGAP